MIGWLPAQFCVTQFNKLLNRVSGWKVLSRQEWIVCQPKDWHIRLPGQWIHRWMTRRPVWSTSVLLVAMGLPGLFRIALDRAPFSGDESQYARASVELFRSLMKSPSDWL